MKTRFLILRPGALPETGEVDWPKKPGFEEIDRVVSPYLGGASLERVAVLADIGGGEDYVPLDMFVDDMGLLKKLPRNEAATLIYRRANLLGMSALSAVSDPEALSSICGPAVLFGRRVWF